MSTTDSPPPSSRRVTGESDHGGPLDTWEQVQASEEFDALRHALRRFVFPATLAFLSWYLLYVVLSAYARDFMDTKVAGVINVAFVFGLLQFVTTFALAYLYSRYAAARLDPLADTLRERLEREGDR
jgi:uncharacterized membrane protein (DUF485 family)